MGLAVGGSCLVLIGAGTALAAGVGTALFATGVRVAAIGALAFNAEAMIFAPFYFIDIDPIEWDF